jgi:SAM-dependent methyltransferase
MKKEIQELLNRMGPFLAPADREFAGRVYSTESRVYEDRLRAIGFTGKNRVLDAGCGFGQWSMALVRLNHQVEATDVQSDRLLFVEELRRALNQENLTLFRSPLETLPREAGWFDAVFCYGVIFCTDWKKTLGEFHRVLAPGGRLYLNANGVGWQLHRWMTQPHATAGFNPRQNAAASFLSTIRYERWGEPPRGDQLIIEEPEMLEALDRLGFAVEAHGPEGSLHLDRRAPPPDPFFKGEYFGLSGCYEVVARRP